MDRSRNLHDINFWADDSSSIGSTPNSPAMTSPPLAENYTITGSGQVHGMRSQVVDGTKRLVSHSAEAVVSPLQRQVSGSPTQSSLLAPSSVVVSNNDIEDTSAARSPRSPDPSTYLPSDVHAILEYGSDKSPQSSENDFNFEGSEAIEPTVEADASPRTSDSVKKTASKGSPAVSNGSPLRSPARSAVSENGDIEEVSLDAPVLGDMIGEMLEPTSVPYWQHSIEGENAVFYPAPIPSKLRLPPLLSRRSRGNAQQGIGRMPRSRNSIAMLDLPDPPNWGPSPLDAELEYSIEQNSEDEGDCRDSDSDRATIMSDEDYRNLPSDMDFEENPTRRRRKAKSWFGTAWTYITEKDGVDENDRDGSYEEIELEEQVDSDLAFTRLDRDIVRQHADMFHPGGVHSNIVPRKGGTTSLIEEIEIRKAGRTVQKQLMLREAQESERQHVENLKRQGEFVHPLDRSKHLSLLQLQQMADADYETRKTWHEHQIHSNNIHANANETLAERLARLRAAKRKNIPEETLAERRARLRKSRGGSSVVDIPGSDEFVAEPGVVNSPLNDEEPTGVMETPPVTPSLSAPHQEFNVIQAVANYSPQSTTASS